MREVGTSSVMRWSLGAIALLLAGATAHADSTSTGLAIHQIVPSSIAPGQSIPVEVVVTNNGASFADAVTVTGALPSGYALDRSDPEARTRGTGLSWSLGRLEAGASRSVKLTVSPKVGVDPEGELRFDFQASHKATASDNRSVKVVRPEIAVAIDAPSEIATGEPFVAKIVVRNDGAVAVKGITVRTGLADGLLHASGSELESACPPLEPRASETIRLALTVTQPGEARAMIRVSAPGMTPLEREFRVKAREVKVTLRTAPVVRGDVGTEARCAVTILNTGEQSIRKPRLIVGLPDGVDDPRGVPKPLLDAVGRALHWEIDELRPHEPVTIQWAFLVRKSGQLYFPLTLRAGDVTRARAGLTIRAAALDPEQRFMDLVARAPLDYTAALEMLVRAQQARQAALGPRPEPVVRIPDVPPSSAEPAIKTVQFGEKPDKAPERLPERADEKLAGPEVRPLGQVGVARFPDLPLPKVQPPKLPEPKAPNVPLLPPPSKVPDPKDFDSEDNEVLLGAARNSVRAGRFDEAIARFVRYIERAPGDSNVREEFAGVLAKAGRIGPAIEEYVKLIPVAGDRTVRLRILLSDLYVQAKEYRMALAQLLWARHEIDPKAVGAAKQQTDVAVRLVRAYLFDDAWAIAQQEYETTLARLRPGDPNIGPLYSLMLLDLDRAADAITFVQALREPVANDPQAYVALARAHSRLGDQVKALEAVQALATRHPRELTVRLQLAETLAQTEDFEIAEQAFAGILQTQPNYSAAQIAYARMQVQLYRVLQARQMLMAIQPEPQNQRAHLLALAECHAACGEYSEARNLLRQLARLWPGDYEVLLALGDLSLSIGDDYKALAEFSKIPVDSWAGRRARVRFGAVLTVQRKFVEALKIFEALAADYPHDPDTLANFSYALLKAGFADRAEALVRSYLTNSARTKTQLHAGQSALGRLLLEVERPRDAIEAYEASVTRTGPKDVYAIFGLALAYLRSGMPDRSAETLATATMSPLSALRARIIFAARFYDEHEDQRAEESAAAALQMDLNNPAAMVQMAEATRSQANLSGDVHEALRAADGLLAGSPGNTRGLLALARTQSIAQNYKASAATYERLIQLDPDVFVAKRELARTLYSGHMYDRAHAAYAAAQLTPDEQFRGDLAMIARSSPKVRDVLTALLASQAPGAIVAPEVRKYSSTVDDPMIRQALVSAAQDFDARLAEAKAAGMEDAAKLKKGIRNWAAIPSYLDLIAYEPSNVEALFDLGQVFGAQKLTHKELDAYRQTLVVDEYHREARIASGRSALELNPRLTTRGYFSNERGFDGVTDIKTLRLSALVEVPFDNEDEVIGFGYSRICLWPFEDKPLNGNILTVTGSMRATDQFLAFGVLNYEQYESRVKDRATFDAGWRLTGDQVSGEVAAYGENVLANGEALNQSIYRTGLRIAASRQETRRWDYGGLYRFGYYSDDNFGNEVMLRSGFIVRHFPHQVKLLAQADFLTFTEQTIFGPFPPPNITGSTHPYFAPSFFCLYRGGVEYTQYLSRDSFLRSNSTYVTANYQMGWDNDFNLYYMFGGMLSYDAADWLTLRAEARFTFSNVYTYGGAGAWMVLRLPFRVD